MSAVQCGAVQTRTLLFPMEPALATAASAARRFAGLCDIAPTCTATHSRLLLLLPYRAVYGNGRGAVSLLMIPLAASLMCTYQCISANARMLYAFSR